MLVFTKTMNKTLQNILKLKIEKAVSESKVIADNIEHKYLAGKQKEIVLSQLIKPVLPHQYDVGSGKVIDSRSFISKETDIIIFSKRLIQPLLFEANFGLFPIESVLACIEVKSSLKKKDYRTTFEKFKEISSKAIISPGSFDMTDRDIKTTTFKPFFEIFSFCSDLTNKSNYPNNEFDRYKEIDKEWVNKPLIRSICIVNRGWWIFWNNKWHFQAPNYLNETIMYLANLVNSLDKIETSRGNPRLGHYIGDIKGLTEI